MKIHRVLFSHRSAVVLHADCARDSLISCEYVFAYDRFIPDDIVCTYVLRLSKFALFDYSFSVCIISVIRRVFVIDGSGRSPFPCV